MEVVRDLTNPEEPHADAPSQEALEAKIKSENGVDLNSLPSPEPQKRRRYTKCYTDENRAAIAKYAVEHGNAAAIRKYQSLFSHSLPESTVRSFKKRYLEELADKRKTSGDATCDISMVPSKKRGRKQKGSFDRSSVSLGDQFEIADMDLLDPSGTLTANGSVDAACLMLSPETTRRLQAQPPVEPPIQPAVPIYTTMREQQSPTSSEESSSPTDKNQSETSKMYSLLLKILSEVSKKEKEAHDEEALFGLQVAANLRRLSNRQKATAKMRIQQALLEIEFPVEA